MKYIKNIFLLLLLLPSLSFADYLDCGSNLNIVLEGKVTVTMDDYYVFTTIHGLLISYKKGQCQVYKTAEDWSRAHGWKNV